MTRLVAPGIVLLVLGFAWLFLVNLMGPPTTNQRWRWALWWPGIVLAFIGGVLLGYGMVSG